jgi:hypothetical protein
VRIGQAKPVDQLTGRLRTVEYVQVQAGHALNEQPLTKLGDDVHALGAEAGRIVGEPLSRRRTHAGAGTPESCCALTSVRVVVSGMMPATAGDVTATGGQPVAQPQEKVWADEWYPICSNCSRTIVGISTWMLAVTTIGRGVARSHQRLDGVSRPGVLLLHRVQYGSR